MFQTSEPQNIKSAYPPINETLPQSSLGYHANNKYDGFPARMSDGRGINASWQPLAVMNNEILEKSGIKSNWEYRKHLTVNALEIMKSNYIEASTDVGYVKRYGDVEGSTYKAPYVYQSYTETTRPHGYENSDLKEMYLTREQLNSRIVSPIITQEQLFNSKITSSTSPNK